MKNFPNDRVIDFCEVKNDDKMLKNIKEYLSHMERFAVGENAKVYDIQMFKGMIGSYI